MKPLVWDNHGCLPLRCEPDFMPELRRYSQAGVDVVSINVTFDLIEPEAGLGVARYFADWISNQDDMYVPLSASDLTGNQGKRLAVVFDIEGAGAVEHNLDLLHDYAALGVRTVSAVYNQPNGIGGGCVAHDDGLTDLGRAFVRRAEAAGVVVCCSHTGYRTARDIVAVSSQPVVCSHSNPLALHEHPRNVPDDLIRLIAQTGGVIGINGVGIFLGENDTSTATLIRHISYIAELVGVEHVGIGLDFAFDERELEGFLQSNPHLFPRDIYGDTLEIVEPERIPTLARALSDAGFTATERDLVMGGNWHRIAQTVWP